MFWCRYAVVLSRFWECFVRSTTSSTMLSSVSCVFRRWLFCWLMILIRLWCCWMVTWFGLRVMMCGVCYGVGYCFEQRWLHRYFGYYDELLYVGEFG